MEELHSWLCAIDHHGGFALATKEVFERLQQVDYRVSPQDFDTIMVDILEKRPLSERK